MLLPGQSRHASGRLIQAMAKVQNRAGKPIIFLDINTNPDLAASALVRGYHDGEGQSERIWLDPGLPYTAQEAAAAHELAHIVQETERFPRTQSARRPDGQPLIAALDTLSIRINNLVLDDNADGWAMARGFRIDKALLAAELPGLMARLRTLSPKKEAADWLEYHARLEAIANKIRSGQAPSDSLEIGAEAHTQALAVDYAGLSIRLGRFGLFGELDRLWGRVWPVSRLLGKKLAGTVQKTGTCDPRSCRRAMRLVIRHLEIPPELIQIRG